MANQEVKQDRGIPATFGEWYLMIREPLVAITDDLSPAETLISHVDDYLAYLSRPEFPQSYHHLWQTHIQAVRTLEQTSFDFLPSSAFFGRWSFQKFLQFTRDIHLLDYPKLDDYLRYCKALQDYSEYVLSWKSPPDHERLMELRRQQVVRTRGRLLSETWDDIREYGVGTPPLLDPYILVANSPAVCIFDLCKT